MVTQTVPLCWKVVSYCTSLEAVGSQTSILSGPTQIQGESSAMDEVQNISILVASTLLLPRQPTCNFKGINKVPYPIPWR